MKSMPQHACDSCNELVDRISALKHEFQRVKRLPEKEMPAELNVLQAQFGALETQAREMKTFVCTAFTTTAVIVPSDQIRPQVGGTRTVPPFPTHAVDPPPPHFHDGINQ